MGGGGDSGVGRQVEETCREKERERGGGGGEEKRERRKIHCNMT